MTRREEIPLPHDLQIELHDDPEETARRVKQPPA